MSSKKKRNREKEKEPGKRKGTGYLFDKIGNLQSLKQN